MTPERGTHPNRQTMEWLESASFTAQRPSLVVLYSTIDMLTRQRDEAREAAHQWKLTAYGAAATSLVILVLFSMLLLVR